MNKDFVFGAQSVLETLRSDLEIEKLLLARGSKSESMREAVSLAKELKIPFTEVPNEKLDRITRKNHQGLICYISSIKYYDLDGIIDSCYAEGKDPFFIVLDGITDVRNLGSIARTAECAGVDALIVPKKGSAQITSDAMKTSSGALNFLKVCRVDRLSSTIKYLKNCGIDTVACTEKTDQLIFNAEINGPCAIIMGSEETGISSEILDLCHKKVAIPMHGKVGSLNVANAASIVLYEALRQQSIS